jgi:predicted aminopeptidase
VLVALAVSLLGCETVEFYRQAVVGQIGLLARREPTQRLVAAADTDPVLRTRLAEVDQILRFARDQLLLPANGQFSSYVHVDGEYVVWSVFATPEFSTQPTQWCYPIIGCASYRGYFKERDARRLGRRLQAVRHDVAVGGVVAYSTLGWFHDPLLSTYIDWEPAQLAGLLFHELAHTKLFVKDDTAFNEGLATFVEREGVRQWLESIGDTTEIDRAQARWNRSDQLVRFMLGWRSQLTELYGQPFDTMARRMLKGDMMDEIDRCLLVNIDALGGSAARTLLREPMNNARLVPIAAYHEYVVGFRGIFDAGDRNWQTFYRRVKSLAAEAVVRRRATIDEFAQAHGWQSQMELPQKVRCWTLTYGVAG